MTLNDVTLAVKAYISAEPWKKAAGGALILGVRKEAGGTGYAVVTGRENGYALAFCPDEQALAGYAALLDAKKRNENELEQVSLTLDQSCIECRLIPETENTLEKWLSVFGVEAVHEQDEQIQILRYQPGLLPQTPEDDELEELSEALFAAADYTLNPAAQEAAADEGSVPCARPDGKGSFRWERIDLSENMRLQFPAPALDDELAARRLRRLPVSGAVVRAAVRRLPMPMDDEALRVPTVMILIDDRMGVVAAPMIGDYDREYGAFASEYIAYVEENGRPARIMATDPRTYSLLSDLAGQMSTPIQRAGSMPEINEAVDGLMEYLRASVIEQFGDEEEEADEPQNVTPGVGGALYDGFEGTMEEVGRHLLAADSQPDADLEENLLIRVTYPEDPSFWLYAAVKEDAALRHIDNFIRNTWVECCGHASLFTIGGVDYTSNTRILPGKSMNAKVMDVLHLKETADYQYDPGTPTELQVEWVGTVYLPARREKALHLAQNYMPKYRCVRCGRRAELVFRPDMEPVEESVICARCFREETETGRYLPLINSPRTGVCGYGLWFGDEDDE